MKKSKPDFFANTLCDTELNKCIELSVDGM